MPQNNAPLLYRIQDKRLVTTNPDTPTAEICFGIAPLETAATVLQALGGDSSFLPEILAGNAAKFESRIGLDLIRLNILNGKKYILSNNPVLLTVTQDRLLVFCDSTNLRSNLAAFAQKAEDVAFDNILYFLFKQLTTEDGERLDHIEAEILALEDRLLEGEHAPEHARHIASLRRKLFTLKGYYEQFYDILDGITENENGFFDDEALRYFRIFQGKLDRLNRHTGNLRDYITQVRESYQAQVDIELNKIMKLFTVITAIIAPLTLIVGWYGMNFPMPEYGWAMGYPVVILISAAVVGVLVYYFKKHRWF